MVISERTASGVILVRDLLDSWWGYISERTASRVILVRFLLDS